MIDILLFSSQLSPKKTWEGFIGGGVTTVIYGWLVSHSFLFTSHLTTLFPDSVRKKNGKRTWSSAVAQGYALHNVAMLSMWAPTPTFVLPVKKWRKVPRPIQNGQSSILQP